MSYIRIGRYTIYQRCNVGGCSNRPTVFIAIGNYIYYGRCSDHAALYNALRSQYSLDDIKADIAMSEL